MPKEERRNRLGAGVVGGSVGGRTGERSTAGRDTVACAASLHKRGLVWPACPSNLQD